jgi:hypothetical protein
MFKYVRVGDVLTRMLGGVLLMQVTVFEISDGIIKARVPEIGSDYWQFDVATGAEIDSDLGWGPPPMFTGSYIVKES